MTFLDAKERTAARGVRRGWLRLSHYCPTDLSTFDISSSQVLDSALACFNEISGINIGFRMEEFSLQNLVTSILRPQALVRVEMSDGCYEGTLLPFALLSQLEELVIRRNRGFSGTLAGISSCTSLRSIVVQDCPLRGDISPLQSCQKLEKAFFTGCKKIKGHLKVLRDLPLRWIGFVDTRVAFDDETLKQLKQLEVAWLDQRNLRRTKRERASLSASEPTCVSQHEVNESVALRPRAVYLV